MVHILEQDKNIISTGPENKTFIYHILKKALNDIKDTRYSEDKKKKALYVFRTIWANWWLVEFNPSFRDTMMRKLQELITLNRDWIPATEIYKAFFRRLGVVAWERDSENGRLNRV